MGPSDACHIEVGKGPGPPGVRKGQGLAAWGLGCALSTLVACFLYHTAMHLRSGVVADLHRRDAQGPHAAPHRAPHCGAGQGQRR